MLCLAGVGADGCYAPLRCRVAATAEVETTECGRRGHTLERRPFDDALDSHWAKQMVHELSAELYAADVLHLRDAPADAYDLEAISLAAFFFGMDASAFLHAPRSPHRDARWSEQLSVELERVASMRHANIGSEAIARAIEYLRRGETEASAAAAMAVPDEALAEATEVLIEACAKVIAVPLALAFPECVVDDDVADACAAVLLRWH